MLVSEHRYSTLAELLSRNDDFANLHYLLDLARKSPKLFRHIQERELLKTIENYSAWIGALENNGFLKNLFINRDKILAHTDKKFITEIESDFTKNNPPRNSNEIRDVYIEINKLLCHFENYYYGTSARVGFVDVELEVKNEIKQIVARKF